MSVKQKQVLSVIGLLFLVSLAVSTSHVCEGDERPHPEGLCGRRLAQAHSNLCFLLREVYHPEFYEPNRRMRRSPRLDGGAEGLVQRIYSIPLDVLAELDFSRDDWQLLLSKKSSNQDTDFNTKEEYNKDLSSSRASTLIDRKLYRHGTNALARRFLRTLLRQQQQQHQGLTSSDASLSVFSGARESSNAGVRVKRTPSSNMVCDCCYNSCSAEELGTYC